MLGSPPARAQASTIAGRLALFYLFLIIYASLTPFSDWRSLSQARLEFLWAPLPKRLNDFDLIINFGAYVPFGILLCAVFRSRLPQRPALLTAALACFALSAFLETAQTLLPSRIPSNLDVLSNGLGGALGAGLWTGLSRVPRVEDRLDQLRQRFFLPGSSVDTGIALMLLWLVSQLNPSIPFFAAGLINNPLTQQWSAQSESWLDWGPRAAGIALNFCGFGLFVSTLMRRRRVALFAALVLVGIAFLLKTLSAEFMLKPVLARDWMGWDTKVGLICGVVPLMLLAGLPVRGRIVTAGATILAGALLSKLAGSYVSLRAALKLFNWPHGQLLNFTGLTVYLNELWPLLALIFLVYYFPRAIRQRARGRTHRADRTRFPDA